MPPMRPPSQSRRAARRILRSVLSILLGLALVVGTLRGGTSYLFCAMMGEVVSTQCCEHDSSPDSIVSPDCCDLGELTALPAGAPQLPSVDVPSAPVRACAAVLPVAFAARLAEVLAEQRHERARAGPPSPQRTRARLMVFLI